MSKIKMTIEVSPKLAFVLDNLSSVDDYQIETTLWRLLDSYGNAEEMAKGLKESVR